MLSQNVKGLRDEWVSRRLVVYSDIGPSLVVGRGSSGTRLLSGDGPHVPTLVVRRIGRGLGVSHAGLLCLGDRVGRGSSPSRHCIDVDGRRVLPSPFSVSPGMSYSTCLCGQ